MRYSNRLAKEAFGWRPHIGLEEGLKRTLEWNCRRERVAARWPGRIGPPGSLGRQFDPEICPFTERS